MSTTRNVLAVSLLTSAFALLLGCSTGNNAAITGDDGETGTAGTDHPGESGSSGEGTSEGSTPGSGGTTGIDLNGTGGENPCLGDNPPDTCQLVASGPACGDGELTPETGEECDDGNSKPGDGCTGICRVEPNFTCPTPGEPCVSSFACGNGVIEPGEVCDDGNTTAGDGCSADCTEQSASFTCPTPGEPCERTEFCGNGRVKGEETCDDGNLTSGDGCSADCIKEDGWLCLVPGDACQPVDVCGDGKQSASLGEQCDDANLTSGDGCSADCMTIESGFQCPTPGEPCINLTVCGDGRVTGTETCDDANTDPADGCDACAIQPGYDCPFPGAKCLPLCGDGVLLLNERCDDGNLTNGDGCSDQCEWEDGFACTGDPGNYTCHATICGDGIVEGTEACDTLDNDMGDGCTPLCELEPDCSGATCLSTCGDGLVLSSVGETCDDGNTVDGDGCSSSCQIEPGYQCEQPPLGDTMKVPAVYRDFAAGGDFEPANATGQYVAVTGLVDGTLDTEGKPVFVGTAGQGYITSAQSFSQWYRDVSGLNATFATEMTLWNNGSGGYVNRWGDNGEQWVNTREAWCGTVGDEIDGEPCTFTFGDTDCQTYADQLIDCVQNGTDWTGILLNIAYEGDPVFFPVDNVTPTVTNTAEYAAALVPPAFGGNWGAEPGGALHNFHFTSEVRYWFTYVAGDEFILDFTGDDDVWVFINKRLAVDLGGIHTPVNGNIVLNADGTGTTTIVQTEPADDIPPAVVSTVDLGLVDGQVYEIVVFQAERKKEASTYKLTLSGFNAARSDCGPICGDGVLSPGEQCDDGVLAGGYGACQPGCIRGEYCGDGAVNGPEACDDGVNVSAYGTTGCAPGCLLPPGCGDGLVQSLFGETCDDGINDDSYGGCSANCQFGPRCGDGQVNDPSEQCDDGANDGSYGNCAPGCLLGPRCGDGTIQEGFSELCDDGNNVGGDGCSPNCRLEGVCGDAIVDTATGEQCDDGINDGGYGECAPGCTLGPRCGDGVTQPEEQCDGGENPTGGYGECAPGCVLGPHCGDGLVQDGYEECDDGNNEDGDRCSAACKNEIILPR